MNETKPTNGATACTHFTLLGRDLRPGDKVTNAELSRLPPGRFDVLVRNHYLSTIEVVEDERQAKTGKAVTVAQTALERAQAVVVEIDKRIAEVTARAETNDDQRGEGVLKLTRARGPKAKAKREAELSGLRGEHSAIDTELQDTLAAKSRAEDAVKRAEHKLSVAEDAKLEAYLTAMRERAIEAAKKADAIVGESAKAIAEMKSALRGWAAAAGVNHASISWPDWWIGVVAKTAEGEVAEYAKQVGTMASFCGRLMVHRQVSREHVSK